MGFLNRFIGNSSEALLMRASLSKEIYFFGLILLAVSMPLSKFTMSIAQFMLVGSWLIGGNLLQKLKRFLTSPITLLFFFVYALHILGVAWSEDTSSAWRDVRIKMPLLLLPLILSTSPTLSMSRYEWVLRSVAMGVMISTWVSFAVHKGLIAAEVRDIRDISIFISHIRLSLLCCITVFIGFWFMNRKGPVLESAIWLIASVWLTYFVLLLQSLTAMLILGVFVAIYMAVIFFRGRMLTIRIVSGSVLLICLFGFTRMAYLVYQSYKPKDQMPKETVLEYTSSGRPFVTYLDRTDTENGYFVWKRINQDELRQEWNKRSRFQYDGADIKGNKLKFTLIRFITSKGLDKDSSAVASLSEFEITAVESGIANRFYLDHSGLTSRFHQAVWEYQIYHRSGDPTGHSITQRLEYWKTGCQIFANNMLFGVGTGDLQISFDRQYEQNQTKLSKDWRLRAHNQYISIAAAFGIFGLALFFIMLLWPVKEAVRIRDHLYLAFLATALISMISEDTLETQAGVTFFAFFSALFLFVHPMNRYIRVKKRV
ncbi:MAG: O-antigen ligase family protein [Bacteroidota bacterium]|jgi:O-antigen ligase